MKKRSKQKHPDLFVTDAEPVDGAEHHAHSAAAAEVDEDASATEHDASPVHTASSERADVADKTISSDAAFKAWFGLREKKRVIDVDVEFESRSDPGSARDDARDVNDADVVVLCEEAITYSDTSLSEHLESLHAAHVATVEGWASEASRGADDDDDDDMVSTMVDNQDPGVSAIDNSERSRDDGSDDPMDAQSEEALSQALDNAGDAIDSDNAADFANDNVDDVSDDVADDGSAPWLQLDLVAAIEAILFASGQPLAYGDLKKILVRHFGEQLGDDHKRFTAELRAAIGALQDKWNEESLQHSGFQLMEVAEGFTFRSNPTYASVLQAMREDKPVRLTRPAMETLAIIAYRQPVTKPEADYIRGVDCGGTLKVLLDRDLVRIVGKKEEPGRPLLYGTTREFLSFFNLTGLDQLPSLRQFHELTEDTQEELRAVAGGLNLQELSDTANALRFTDEPTVGLLEEAVAQLASTEDKARLAFAGAGIQLAQASEDGPALHPSAGQSRASDN